MPLLSEVLQLKTISMGGILLYFILGVTGIILGSVITGTILNRAIERKRDVLLKEAMDKAEVVKKEKILQAKEKFLQLKGEHEKFMKKMRKFHEMRTGLSKKKAL
jgi:ribonuclease Y